MDAAFPHLEGLPEQIRTKYQLFQEQEETIHRLEAELENLRKEHAQLEEELAPYRSSIKHETQLFRSKHWQITYPRHYGSIYACPEEVLYEIFRYYLASHHYRIPDLLLVCKTWYDIIMGNPRLWARIQTPLIDEDDAYSTLFDDITIPYIEACLKRSRDLPLEIDLSLDWMPSFHDYILHHTSTALEGIIDMENFQDRFWTMEWHNMDFSYKYRFFDLLQDDVERWKHISITFPYDTSGAEAVLKSLPLARANLQSLELLNIDSQKFHSWSFDTSLLPNLSSLERLNSSTIPLSKFIGSPSSLMELKIIITRFTDIPTFFGCSMLQSLTIEIRDGILPPEGRGRSGGVFDDIEDYDNWNYSTVVPDKPLPLLHLSSLKKLAIIGAFEPLSRFNFDIPVLEYLEIYPRARRYSQGGPYDVISMPELPKISTRRIYWRLYSWDPNKFTHSLDCVLSQFQEAEIIKMSIPVGYSSSLAVLFKPHAVNKVMIIKSRASAEKLSLEELDGILICLQKWVDGNGYSLEMRQDLDIDYEFLKCSNPTEPL